MPENMAGSNADIHASRRDKLRPLLAERGLDALLVSNAANRFYLSGFELHDPQPGESAGCLIICADGRDILFTDSRYTIAAERIWPGSIHIHNGPAADELRHLLARCGLKIGIESNNVSWRFVLGLSACNCCSGPAYVPADGLVESMRVIKDASEIAALRKSFSLNHKMLAWLEQEIGADRVAALTEKELAWQIEKFFRENGAQELAFASIVAAGANSALPHAIPGQETIGRDRPLLIDIGCRLDNYCSDQTRTYWIGKKPAPEFKETLELVKTAQSEAIAAMRPGMKCRDAYLLAYKVFEKAGVEKFFNHGLGHGVGLQTHEAPSLSARSNDILRPGMTVTVEPGLYYAEWGGARWEHTVLISETGAEIL